jgi:hypothetical protein
VVTWTADDTFELGGTTFVCRPIGRRFPSQPGRFCLLKTRAEVEWYERFLRERQPKSIFEVGSYDGGSGAFLTELAQPKRLVTIDQRPEPSAALTDFIARRHLDGVVTAYNRVDQSDVARLRAIVDEAFGGTELDLVIDDASHLVAPTRATFNCLFPVLAPGASYLIEDWSWAHSGLGDHGKWADEQPLTSFVFELVLACAYQSAVVANVNVLKNYTVVERGPAALDETFDVASCYGPRGAALLADRER